ncbi:MAG: carbohydrate ABC transporter permease [Clostridia bacterium]|nr:carbohydrate ABC transporter permease [Clostridia bacterium]
MAEFINKLFGSGNSEKTSNASSLAAYRTKRVISSVLISIFRYALLISVSYVVLYPLFYMISNSVKDLIDWSDPNVFWIPKHFTGLWYDWAMGALDFFNALKNTVLFELVAAFLEILSCSLVAYGLARFKFRGKSILMFMLILTILVPDQMIIIPKMMNFANLDLFGIIGLINKISGAGIRINILNTGFVFYLPSIFAVGLRSGIIIYIYMQFYKGLPRELEEAAWIDGAGLFKTYTKIALPSSGVVITTVSIFSIIWHWNDYYLAIMYMNDAEAMPLAVRLSNIQAVMTTLHNVWGGAKLTATQCAACILFIAPMLIMYIILQRKFVKSIDRVGITG